MNIRRFRSLFEAGASYAEIARECGSDWRTVRKYVAEDAPSVPPVAPRRVGTQPRVITPVFEALIEASLRADLGLKATVIHERLVAEHQFNGSYQRVKMFCAGARPRIAAELEEDDDNPLFGFHRRFETTPGAQAQVDWGEEGDLFGTGVKVYSFHMVLSYSRDPFCCYTTSMDMAAFWGSHARAFAHFGGVPGSIVYDRTKTVIRRHVGPGKAVPLHPIASGFAGHYGFDIDVLAAYRPTGKGRVERQVNIVRDHVLGGRVFESLAEVDTAFMAWVPIRRAQVHRTHGQVIGVRAITDHAALRGSPVTRFEVNPGDLRRVGKDALVSFAGSFYSVPARRVRPGQRVVVRADAATVRISAMTPAMTPPMTPPMTNGVTNGVTSPTILAASGEVLATHDLAARKGWWVVDPAHWDGLPDGHTRATTTGTGDLCGGITLLARHGRPVGLDSIPAVLAAHAPDVHVAVRPLVAYEAVLSR